MQYQVDAELVRQAADPHRGRPRPRRAALACPRCSPATAAAPTSSSRSAPTAPSRRPPSVVAAIERATGRTVEGVHDHPDPGVGSAAGLRPGAQLGRARLEAAQPCSAVTRQRIAQLAEPRPDPGTPRRQRPRSSPAATVEALRRPARAASLTTARTARQCADRADRRRKRRGDTCDGPADSRHRTLRRHDVERRRQWVGELTDAATGRRGEAQPRPAVRGAAVAVHAMTTACSVAALRTVRATEAVAWGVLSIVAGMAIAAAGDLARAVRLRLMAALSR